VVCTGLQGWRSYCPSGRRAECILTMDFMDNMGEGGLFFDINH
jgi:hypothetical protein